MRNTLLALACSAAALTAAQTAQANGLDRVTVPPTYLFEDGRYIQIRYAHTNPFTSGKVAFPTTTPGVFLNEVDVGSIWNSYNRFGASYKQDITDKISFGIDFSQPYGSNVTYPTGPDQFLSQMPNPTDPADPPIDVNGPSLQFLSGANIELQADALTLLARYKFNDRFSVFGGPRAQRFRGTITSYQDQLIAKETVTTTPQASQYGTSKLGDGDIAFGFQGGVAYERKEMALRVALTYTSAITNDSILKSDTFGKTKMTLRSPHTLQLAFQTGILPETLLFGGYRYARWSDANIDLAGQAFSDFPDVHVFSLGIGRNVHEKLFLSTSVQYQLGEDSPVGSLSPYEYRTTLGLGARFQATEKVHISAGSAYTWLSDATTVTGGDFTDSEAISFGVDLGINF